MIYTFYSFKGGVGRSMALANVAECFYERGLRVIVIDWDLEAPGIENYFYSSSLAGASLGDLNDVQAHKGLIDMLVDYKSCFPQLYRSEPLPSRIIPSGEPAYSKEQSEQVEQAAALAKSFLEKLVDLPEELRQVNFPVSTLAGAPQQEKSFAALLDESLPPLEQYLCLVHQSKGRSLHLMTAGARPEGKFTAYASAVQEFDWLGFYAAFEGKEYFDWLREKLARLADVVLIDSRTGVTEMGGVCTRQMADAVIAFCAPNFQNVDGVAKVLASLSGPAAKRARGDRDVQAIVVPTRIDRAESGFLGEFAQSFHDKIERNGQVPAPMRGSAEPLWSLRVPYVPRYNYMEQLVVAPVYVPTDPPSKELAEAYRRIATSLAVLGPPGGKLFQSYTSEIAVRYPLLGPQIVLSSPAGSASGRRVRRLLTDNGLRLWPDITPFESEYRGSIDRAGTLVALLTENAAANSELGRQVRYARQQGRAVYLVSDFNPSQDLLPRWAWTMTVLHLEEPQALLNALSVAQVSPRIPFMAPAPPPGAIVRTQPVTQLRRLLTSASVVVLSGAPGSGKSTLLAQVCQDDAILERFPDGIVWLELGPTPDLPSKWRDLYIALFGPENVPNEVNPLREQVTSRLGRGQFLVVLDDCWNRDRGELPRLGPSSCLVVVVIRRDFAGFGEASMVLEDLSQAEAASLLVGKTLVRAAEADPILEKISTSPIAVSLARAALEAELEQGHTPAEAISRLGEKIERHGVIAFDDTGAAARNRSVARCVRTSLRLLDGAQRSFLVALAESDNESVTVEHACHLLEESEDRTVLLLRTLHDAFFLEYDAAGRRARWNALVRRYLQKRPSSLKKREYSANRRQMSSRDWRTNRNVQEAMEIMRPGRQVAPEALYQLAMELKAARYFGLARQLIARARQAAELPKESKTALRYIQQEALCTYKNTEAPIDQRLAEALNLLREQAALDTTKDPETLGIAGAITKEGWKYDGQRATLERSLAYYLRGAEAGIGADDGYTSLNASFILDVLAGAEQENGDTATAVARRQQARHLRERIVGELAPRARARKADHGDVPWWTLVTIAEACFGLRNYEDALYWLNEALSTNFDEWEYESTARQLATLLVLAEKQVLSGEALLAAHETLRVFLGNDAAVVESVRLGKVGLALSGGGFRAAFFHIGVLARLAELDFLRHVEVLSCVSGGSIIGAHYYLEVRKLLNEKPDYRISRQDYLDIVQRLATNFLAAVQRNIRNRVATNLWVNLKTAVVPNYSRTNRIGELYESEIYSRVKDGHKGPRFLDQLTITPPDEDEDFAPKHANWRRSAKAPVLVLNATTLNTGNNWQFTVSWMGEPPSSIVSEIDANDLLQRMYYWQAPERHRNVRLGHAVAASACVPGLFEPLALSGLYPERVVQLVDGGVQDNQGIGSLIEQECTVMLVSDGSGQMSTIRRPSIELIGVPLRANEILQARVRETEYLDLCARRQASLIRGLLFVHLKKDLAVDPIDRVGAIDSVVRASHSQLTRYGIDTRIQERLAEIRTDLDSFHDKEAFALMLSGYRMTETCFVEAVPHAQVVDVRREAWGFLAIEPSMGEARAHGDAQRELQKLLDVSSSRVFKAWRVSAGPWLVSAILVLLLLNALLRLGTLGWQRGWHAQDVARTTAVVVVGVVGFSLLLRLLRQKSVSQFLIGLSLVPGAALAWLHLTLFDPFYLAAGKLTRRTAVERQGLLFRLPLEVLALTLGLLGLVLPLPTTEIKSADPFECMERRLSVPPGDPLRTSIERVRSALPAEASRNSAPIQVPISVPSDRRLFEILVSTTERPILDSCIGATPIRWDARVPVTVTAFDEPVPGAQLLDRGQTQCVTGPDGRCDILVPDLTPEGLVRLSVVAPHFGDMTEAVPATSMASGISIALSKDSALPAVEDAGQAEDNGRYRIFLHLGRAGKRIVPSRGAIEKALKGRGFRIAGVDELVDAYGPGVDYFSKDDSGGATRVAEVLETLRQVGDKPIQVRPQSIRNPPGYLGVWF